MSEPESVLPDGQVQHFGQVWVKIENVVEDISENHNATSEELVLPDYPPREELLNENTTTKRKRSKRRQRQDIKEKSEVTLNKKPRKCKKPNKEVISESRCDIKRSKTTIKQPVTKNRLENLENVRSDTDTKETHFSIMIKDEILESEDSVEHSDNVNDENVEECSSEIDPIDTKPCVEEKFLKTPNADSTTEAGYSQTSKVQGMDNDISNEMVTIEVDVDKVMMDDDCDDDDDEWTSRAKPAAKKGRRKYERRKRSPGQSLMCDECDYTTRHHALLLRHIIRHKVKDKSDDLQTYECEQCPYKSYFKTNYVAHMRRKHQAEETKDRKYKCKLCYFSSPYQSNLQKHLKVHKPKENTLYKCDKCHFVTKFEGFITRHLSQVHNEVLDKASKCDSCNFITKERFRLNVHKKRSYRETPLKCDYCELTTQYMCEFKLHRAMHIATKSFINSSAINTYTDNLEQDNADNPEIDQDSTDNLDHDNIENPNQSIAESPNKDSANNPKQDFIKPEHYLSNSSDHSLITTEPDLNTFGFFSALKTPLDTSDHTNMNIFYPTNMNILHQPNMNSVQQTNINSVQQTNVNSVHHTYVNTVQPNLNSNQPQSSSKNTAAKKVKRKDSSQFLINTDYANSSKSISVREFLVGSERHFGCSECDYTSKFKGSVQRHHFRLHCDDIRPYTCVNCDYSTKTRDKITLHTKRSTSEIPLKCLHCDFKSNYKCELNLHQKSHSNFKCDMCKEGFGSAASLRTHFTKVHQNNGLKCGLCDFVAIRRESLISHEATHTGLKPFQCKHCEYGCMTSRSLQNHRIKHHGLGADTIVYIDDSKIKKLKVEPTDVEVVV